MTLGLCYGTSFDIKYSWTGELTNGVYSFRGYTDTFLYHEGEDVWRLQLISRPEVYARVNSTDYPFGKLRWAVYNESCYDESPHLAEISINVCTDDQFSCDDGRCIPMEQRCNGRVECADNTGWNEILFFAKYPPQRLTN